jgi:hypothetical protein
LIVAPRSVLLSSSRYPTTYENEDGGGLDLNIERAAAPISQYHQEEEEGETLDM